jgi:hypothetical protein
MDGPPATGLSTLTPDEVEFCKTIKASRDVRNPAFVELLNRVGKQAIVGAMKNFS